MGLETHAAVDLHLDYYVAFFQLFRRQNSEDVELTRLISALAAEYPTVDRNEIKLAAYSLTVDHKFRSRAHADHQSERQIPTPQHDLFKINRKRAGHYYVKLYEHSEDKYWGIAREGKGLVPCVLQSPPPPEIIAAFDRERSRAEAASPLIAERQQNQPAPKASPPRRQNPPSNKQQTDLSKVKLPHPLGEFCSLATTLLQNLKERPALLVEGKTTFDSDSLEFIGRQTDGSFLCAVVLADGAVSNCFKAIARMSVAAAFAGRNLDKVLIVPGDVSDTTLTTLKATSPDVRFLTYSTTLQEAADPA